MAKDREIELKLAIQPADAATFRRLLLLHGKGVVGPKRRKVIEKYIPVIEALYAKKREKPAPQASAGAE